MRFFIALEIPTDSRQQLETVQQELEQIIPGIRLTNNGKLHLTIAFIGEQPDKLQGDLTQVLQKAAQGISPFSITPAYIDGFPSLHHTHTFWVGVKGDTDKLMVLRERIKDGLISLGLDIDERRYVPHIAIGKMNNNFSLQPDQENKLQALMMDNFEPIQITSIKLFESIPEEPARIALPEAAASLQAGTQSVAGGGFHTHNTLAEIPLSLP
ncbi:2'-5' RNA ligase [Candidatus Daviesbacteria bacterium RIFCSPLOWO2_01_FULL_43_38]|uniref:RNA 2',3'-cyclic phosphodiesterase n=2 Tax=Candidatus Daviesiibacteriota TaxID=1752718 RepID=A0A1F5K7S9_9BACT|nr:MAG: 2'-5' RNA ligase [Candidatus Daviesbacteria bacterium RIFCSPHIGHO2_12_FULL_43_11]OGE63560.1 MAG: 2'-5' RNA ligase [Candidatus Daviesbacteria bacterium RIFCSPLOWO2_01_FULL_43_38]OGE70863.1 MAG: 2'-5' RNA ligase [Candidatus Daviesbacteria bacterium RIFCSPLOWO2_02_FULL_43_11]